MRGSHPIRDVFIVVLHYRPDQETPLGGGLPTPCSSAAAGEFPLPARNPLVIGYHAELWLW